jgi:hypothetical protein
MAPADSVTYLPSALDILTSDGALDPLLPENVVLSRLREMVGSDLPEGKPVDEEGVVQHWVDYIVGLILDKKDCVVIVDGTPGEGKSTFSLWICLRIREALNRALKVQEQFKVDRDVTYRLSSLIHRINQSSREKPSVVLADEGILVGAQARAGSYDASIILERVLSIARIKGVTMFILAPSIWGLAASVRDRRARLWFHVEERGRSTAFVLRDAIPFKRPKELPFGKARQPWCRIEWGDMESDPIWTPYEGQKLDITTETLADSEVEALKIERKAGLRPPEWATVGNVKRAYRAANDSPADFRRKADRERKQKRNDALRARGFTTRGRKIAN